MERLLHHDSSFNYPKATHVLHRFQQDGIRYVIDLDADMCIEVDPIVWEILGFCSNHTTEGILGRLSRYYEEREILQAFELLQTAEANGLFFVSDTEAYLKQKSSKRPRLFIPMPSAVLSDTTYLSSGVPVATINILRSLARYADLYLLGENRSQIEAGIYSLPLDLSDQDGVMLHFLKHSYDGIYLQGLFNFELPTHFFKMDCPVVIRLDSPRSYGGDLINTVLRLYACLRPFDAFCPCAHSIRQFYSQFVLNLDAFHVVPNGVDTEMFQPMEKSIAKQQVADLLGHPEIAHQKVVGFFGRFQPEKGASIYLQIARMNPDLLFLVVAPTLWWYELRELPPNLIYAGRQPREKLPLFLNAFDLHCFPTVVGEEAFSLAVLESMACGVPPVVSDLADLRFCVGDAGVVIEANLFRDEIGNFAGSVSPQRMSAEIRDLLDNEERRKTLGEKARERVLQFTWDATAQGILGLFQKLNLRKKLHQPALPQIGFVPHFSLARDEVTYQSALINLTQNDEDPLMFPAYPQTIEEGIALSLLKDHSLHEIEACLLELCDKEKAMDILQRIRGVMEALT
ncbi:glycosyltransferase [Candidatus Poribacteria bacterium]|nr:glycosyltransferase [Candidatus Poribacteria bacterium]